MKNIIMLAGAFLLGSTLKGLMVKFWPDTMLLYIAEPVVIIGLTALLFTLHQVFWASRKPRVQAKDPKAESGEETLETLIEAVVAEAEKDYQSTRRNRLITASCRVRMDRENSHPGRGRFCKFCGADKEGHENCDLNQRHPQNPCYYDEYFCDICGARKKDEKCNEFLHERV